MGAGRRSFLHLGLVLLLTASVAPATTALAKNLIGGSVVIAEPLNDDLYAAGGEVLIQSSVAGSAVAGAGTADLSGDVEGDLIIGAGRIDLSGGVGDDLRAVGGNVRVTGFITDQATIAGGTVTIGPGSAIGGRTWIAAGDLEMAGQIGDDLRVAARTVVISGRVAGNVEVAAREIRVEPGALIGGDLVWRGGQPPVIAEDAQILGEVRAAGEGEPRTGYEVPGPGLGWAPGIAAFVATLLLSWLAPHLVTRAGATFQAAPGRTLVLGVASMLLTPVIAVFLFATVIGWLVGMLVLVGYVFGLMLSGLLGLLIAVHILRGRFDKPAAPTRPGAARSLLLLILVVLGVVLAQEVPLLGGLLNGLLVLAGFGALTAMVTGRAPPPLPSGGTSPTGR